MEESKRTKKEKEMKPRIPRKIKKEIKKDVIIELEPSYLNPNDLSLFKYKPQQFTDKHGFLINLRIRF